MKLLLINKHDNRILTSLDSETESTCSSCLKKFTEVSEEIYEEYKASSGTVYFIEDKIVSSPKKSKSKKTSVEELTEEPLEEISE